MNLKAGKRIIRRPENQGVPGKASSLKPDIILLDEPTNHLDMESIAWLEGYLTNYAGTVVIVAHDRYFLDRVVTKIIELDNGKATTFQGNYSAYSEKKRCCAPVS